MNICVRTVSFYVSTEMHTLHGVVDGRCPFLIRGKGCGGVEKGNCPLAATVTFRSRQVPVLVRIPPLVSRPTVN